MDRYGIYDLDKDSFTMEIIPDTVDVFMDHKFAQRIADKMNLAETE